MLRERRPHAIEKRIAGGEDANLTPPRGDHLLDALCEGARPRPRRALDQGGRQLEMARAPKHEFRR